MAAIQQKIEAEHRMRQLLHEHDLPEPDAIEYGLTCIRVLFDAPKVCLVIDIDEDPDGGDGDLRAQTIDPRDVVGD